MCVCVVMFSGILGMLALTDSEGDVVTLSSDEELVEALDQFEGGIFRLYLKKGSNFFSLKKKGMLGFYCSAFV